MIFKIISAVTLSFMVGAASGYWKGGNDNQLQANADKKTSLERLIEQTALLDEENDEIARAWLEQQSDHETIIHTVEAEVTKYVPVIQKNNSVCNITMGAECLLNAARLNISPAAECGSLTDAEKRTASPVTEEGLIKADTQCADKYNALATRCDALVDVVANYQKRTAATRRGDDG